jgi:hypothetical protein
MEEEEKNEIRKRRLKGNIKIKKYIIRWERSVYTFFLSVTWRDFFKKRK